MMSVRALRAVAGIVVACVVTACLASGCISVGWRSSDKKEECPRSAARYKSVIDATLTLSSHDRAAILKQLAAKPDLTPADRDLITQQALTISGTDRAAILLILAGGKAPAEE